MAKSSTRVPKKYRGIAASNFALGKGNYPINTRGRADSALSRIAANGTPAQQATVKAKVHRKYPGIKIAGTSMKRKLKGK